MPEAKLKIPENIEDMLEITLIANKKIVQTLHREEDYFELSNEYLALIISAEVRVRQEYLVQAQQLLPNLLYLDIIFARTILKKTVNH